MSTAERLITEHLDTWSSAIKAKSSAGRGGGKKQKFYGIKRLRELILELASRGLLVPQDPNDEPASALLKKVAAEESRLVKAEAIRERKEAPKINDNEKPFVLPSSWAWIRLAEAGHDWGQKTPESDFTYIDVGSINKEQGLVFTPSVLSADEAPSRARKIVREGTVVYSTVRPYLLNIAIVSAFDPEPIASTAFAIIHPFKGIEASFLYRYLRSPAFISYVERCQTGIAYPAINDKQFFLGVMPLPPLAEQYRIVAKVDGLMALCDQFELQQENSARTHNTLVQALLGALTAASKRDQFEEAWRRIECNFDTLFTAESSIDQLKQTILQLAVMGKLVEQDPEDEPAEALIERVSHSLPNKKSENPFLSEIEASIMVESEFELPQGWAWLPLGHVGIWATGCGFPTQYQGQTDREFLFCKVSDMNLPGNEIEIRTTVSSIDSEVMTKIRARPNPVGTVIFPKIGGAIATHKRRLVIKPTIIDNNCSGIRPIGLTYDQWLLILMRSLDLTKYQSGTSVPAVSQSSLDPIRIGLPPLAEQHRIVTKLDELMALCDHLKASFQTAQVTQLNLADSLVEAAIR